MGWTTGVRILAGAVSRPALGPTQWIPQAISPGVKWPGHEADHSAPPNAKVKNGEAIPPLPQMSSWHSA
jgi:hypothetical protein